MEVEVEVETGNLAKHDGRIEGAKAKKKNIRPRYSFLYFIMVYYFQNGFLFVILILIWFYGRDYF